MADEQNNIDPNTGNPPMPDFLNMDGGISPDALSAAPTDPNGAPNFATAPGAISVEALEKAEQEMAQNQPAFQPVNIPAPPQPGQPLNVNGNSGFDTDGMNNFFNKYNNGSANSVNVNQGHNQQYQQPPQPQQPATGLSPQQQAAALNDIFSGGNGLGKQPVPQPRNRRQTVEEQRRPLPGKEQVMGCRCDEGCENTSCVFYGRSNFMSINDIIEDEIQARVEEMLDSGELEVRKLEHRKKKLKKNKYLSDISDSLLGLD